MNDRGWGLSFWAAVSSGLYAGTMLTEAGVLVPFWQSVSPAEFLTWYAANADRLVRFFGPLTVLTPLLLLGAAGAALRAGAPGRGWAVAAAVGILVCAAMFPLYFEAANARFAAGTIPPDDLPAALAEWGLLHNVRTAISSAVAVAAVAAYGARA